MLATGAFSAAIAVIGGAFGTHTLGALLSEKQINIFEVAVRYQMYHAIALILTGIIYIKFPHLYFRYAAYCFTAGTIIFSGTLYLLSTSELWWSSYLGWLGALTPIGGLFLISGWVLFGIATMKSLK